MFKKLEQVIFDTRDNKSIFSLISLVIYPMDFKLYRDGKGVNPRAHR